MTPKPPVRRPAGPLTSLPPPLGGGDVPARPPDEPPQEGKAPTTPSRSPPFLPSRYNESPLLADGPAKRRKPVRSQLPFLSSCVSTVKMWLDDVIHGTRRFYLFSLARVPTAVSPSPVSLIAPRNLMKCRYVACLRL